MLVIATCYYVKLLFFVMDIVQTYTELSPFFGQDEHSHAQLAEQFKLHTIRRVYISLTCGVPHPNSGRIEASIARDPNNRVRMIAIAGSGQRYARHAASR